MTNMYYSIYMIFILDATNKYFNQLIIGASKAQICEIIGSPAMAEQITLDDGRMESILIYCEDNYIYVLPFKEKDHQMILYQKNKLNLYKLLQNIKIDMGDI